MRAGGRSMKNKYIVTANSSEPTIYHKKSLFVFAEARCRCEKIEPDKAPLRKGRNPIECFFIKYGPVVTMVSPYILLLAYSIMVLGGTIIIKIYLSYLARFYHCF